METQRSQRKRETRFSLAEELRAGRFQKRGREIKDTRGGGIGCRAFAASARRALLPDCRSWREHRPVYGPSFKFPVRDGLSAMAGEAIKQHARLIQFCPGADRAPGPPFPTKRTVGLGMQTSCRHKHCRKRPYFSRYATNTGVITTGWCCCEHQHGCKLTTRPPSLGRNAESWFPRPSLAPVLPFCRTDRPAPLEVRSRKA
jgi:hypothetical protein